METGLFHTGTVHFGDQLHETEVIEYKLMLFNADNEKMIDDGKQDGEDVVRKRTGGSWKKWKRK